MIRMARLCFMLDVLLLKKLQHLCVVLLCTVCIVHYRTLMVRAYCFTAIYFSIFCLVKLLFARQINRQWIDSQETDVIHLGPPSRPVDGWFMWPTMAYRPKWLSKMNLQSSRKSVGYWAFLISMFLISLSPHCFCTEKYWSQQCLSRITAVSGDLNSNAYLRTKLLPLC